MIYQAAEIVKSFIEESNLSFIDKIGGLVKTYEKQDGQGNTSRFPIAYNVTETECQNGKYVNFAPDSTNKSAIYFEGDRVSATRSQGKVMFEGDLKLVCWMNLEKLGYQSPFSQYAIPQILKAIPEQAGNITPEGFTKPQYQRVVIKINNTETDNIFSRYSYKRRVLFFPYDYFAINMTVKFEVNFNCMEIPEPGGQSCS